MERVRKQVGVPDEEGIPEKKGTTSEHKFYGTKGVTVAVLDTGIARHPDLSGRLLSFRDFVNGRMLMYDDNGHGTHVCGIICGSGAASNGRIRGIAPHAGLVVGKVLDVEGNGNTDSMLNGLDWVLKVREQFHIRVLNISVGIGELDSTEKEKALKKKIEEVWNAGIVVVCAAGNKGPAENSVSTVGGNAKVITVGCHDGIFCVNHPRCCESYSGRGLARARVRKPDLVAPGTDIVSCNGAFHNFHKSAPQRESAYIAKSGTSMATPIVSGAAVLALEKYPEMTNEELRQKITMTATDLGEAWNKQGWGMLNVKALLM